MQLLTEAWMWLVGNYQLLLCIGIPALACCIVIASIYRDTNYF
jgi:hypothetical protein